MYDLIAKRNSTWGYLYPFIELALGLAYLAFLWPTATYIATIIVFTFGAIGVVLALGAVSTLHVHAWGTCFRSRFPP